MTNRFPTIDRAVFVVCAVILPFALNHARAANSDPPRLAGTSVEASRHDLECVGCGKARALALRYLARKAVLEDDPGWTVLREGLDDTDLLHNNLDIEIFPSSATISGSNTMTIQSLVDGLTELTFRLRANFTITSAIINGTTPVTISDLSTTTRQATLDRAYATGEIFTLEIAYNGPAVSLGLGSIEFTSQNGEDLVFTLSEPYYSYTWWPCKDGDLGEPGDNADKATLELAVTAPDNMRSVSNGLLVGVDTLPGNRSRYRWASDYPITTYLVCFSSTNYNTWTVDYDYGSGTMPVEFNIFPAEDTPSHRQAWEKCIQMLDTFREVYGLYPFIEEKYGIYEFAFGGAMEHQTNTGQGTFSEWITAHELAHQWWGDAVTCRTWHDIWLNEGFATYGEALWAERKPGSSGLPALFAWMANRRPSNVNGSVYVYDTSNLWRIFSNDFSYRKGAWVLHQLRHVVGDDTFFDILAQYRAAFEDSAATTDDFATVAAAVYGQDLTWFFDEWVYGIGAPAYQYGWETDEINGQNYLRLYIDQVQQASYGTFIMPIDVRVGHAGGSETYVAWNDADSEHFVIPIPGAATDVVLDEFDWILHTSLAEVSYVAGPPVVAQTGPLPGEAFLPSAAPDQLTVTFSEDVNCGAADFSVEEEVAGPVTFTFSYSAGGYTATLDFGGPLPAGSYTVTISDSIQSTNGIALDGEISDPADPSSLPSGEGLPGGDAVFTFSVICAGDLDDDGDVDLSDLATLLSNYGVTSDAGYEDGDLDADGDVDLDDLSALLANYGSGC
ncbi:MAG: M1 family aminopeptidase [Phycisphaerae bacterium]